jgi:hypothetical protein
MLATVISVLACLSGAVAAGAAAEDGYENAPGEVGRSGAGVAPAVPLGGVLTVTRERAKRFAVECLEKNAADQASRMA